MAQHLQQRPLPVARQRRPQSRRRPTVLAHGANQATEPAQAARHVRFSVIRRSPSNYQRQHVWGIEQTFRTAKHLFSTRPIFHKLDETIRGHVFCSFLALVLKTTLEERIAALGHSGSWPDILADLDSLTETEIEYDGKRFIVRSAPRPAASLALRAAGVALPPTVRDATAS
ncbi:MAG: hypothetical protein WBW73_17965 [Rhodoplanes sp.]